jgi:hypothetical protein
LNTEAKIISIEIKDDIIYCTCEPEFGHNIQAPLYLQANEESVPLPGDYVTLVKVPGKESYVAVGVLPILDNADEGEKKIFSRDSGGNVKAKIYLDKTGKLTIDTDSDIDINGGGTITIDGTTNIELNGNSKSFVTYTELNMALQLLVTALNSHTHTGVQAGGSSTGTPGSPMTLDISSSETSTIKTGG